MMDINWFIMYALISRTASIMILIFAVLPTQVLELKRQRKQATFLGGEFYRLALTLTLIVLSTIIFSIVPVGYQVTRLDTPANVDLQNLSSFFTNTIILLQSVGWYLVYRVKYK